MSGSQSIIGAINNVVVDSAVKPTKLGYDPSPSEKPSGNHTGAHVEAHLHEQTGGDDADGTSGEVLVGESLLLTSPPADDDALEAERESNKKLHCSYKKCNNKSATKEQINCAVSSCKKKHVACFHHYLQQSSFDFDLRDDVFCCETKACCSKFHVGNQGPTTRWDSDGPNGPNTVPNSESVVLDWWTTGDNWSIYKGGKQCLERHLYRRRSRPGRCFRKKFQMQG